MLMKQMSSGYKSVALDLWDKVIGNTRWMIVLGELFS